MGAGTPLRSAGGPGSVGDGPGAVGTLPEVARAAVAGTGSRGDEGGWSLTVEGFWCTARPSGPAAAVPAQGWKIHVSAASPAAAEVLSTVASVIAADPCTFKFAADREKLHEINSRNSERGSAGKFITVYPVDEEQFRRIAEELHRATEGLPGPVILSDRPYAPGSRVHYRYGVIAARAELGNDGAYRSTLTGPDGSRTEDVRGASYRCPPWAIDPVEGRGSAAPGARGAAPTRTGGTTGNGTVDGKPIGGDAPGNGSTGRGSRPGGVLLGGRYALTAAIRHGTKGGVFLGRDNTDGTEVVVKQARAHIEVDRSGREARTALRHEGRLLEHLDGRALTPHPVELIEQGDSLFLVQERITGRTLGSWVAERLRRDGTPDIAWAEAGPLALALTDLVERVHAEGLVVRDLAPGNVMVRPDGSLRLIDLELAAEAGSTAGSAGTPGYRAPEHGPGLTNSRAEYAGDLYALGGLFFLLATGHDPLLPEDSPEPRPVTDRLGHWLAAAAHCGETARHLAPLVLALRAERPGQRWETARVRAALADALRPDAPPTESGAGAERPTAERPETAADTPAQLPCGPTDALPTNPLHRARPDGGLATASSPLPAPGRALSPALTDRLLADGLRQLAESATPERGDRLWPTVPAGQLTDPCNVQHGAAGVLAVLARAAVAPLPGAVREQALRTARLAAEWIERRCAAEPVVLPGLHFGRSGAAWALLDAAEALADGHLADRAEAMARQVQTVWPNPDVCHGAAGAGFLQLRLYRSTGSAEHLGRAAECARGLLAAARREPYGTVWSVPKSFDSSLAGITHLGYGHGVAGVGAFLLAVAEATGDDRLLAGAREAAGTLAATVRRDGPGGRAGWWPQSAGDPESVRLAHWCNGASGAGSFLIRLWRATGDRSAYELAVAAGQAVLDGRWHSGTSACHGLAGSGEYLLDLSEATGESRFRSAAWELADLIAARSALRDGLLVLPDETGTGCTPAYGTGSSGALAFLLRLRHGGPRIWLDPRPPATRSGPGTAEPTASRG
ncbi:class IV lanthionine synthetase LanL [Kitasatospora sp. NPDC001175]|uniref:class IV lanthionine synthetase LanL n=1 Tax=Kitasatospora sp. NPDC001175 TaxID=3157103 RepID=UPI003D059935